jgi:hypothetical protein
MGGTDLDAFLRGLGVTKEQVVRDARSEAVDIAGTIHDEILRYRESVDAPPPRDGDEPVSRGPDEFTEEIEELLAELRTHLEILIVVRDVTLKEITIDDIAPWDVTPYLTLAARAQRGARSADRTDASPTPRSTARAALDIALNRVDRYVKGIATLFGEPIIDQPTDEREPQ